LWRGRTIREVGRTVRKHRADRPKKQPELAILHLEY
jgi:hypothetical protein